MSPAPYIQPVSTVPLPRGLTLTQFLQTVFVGVSGFPGPLVRPKWQPEPPKNPDLDVDWLAIGVKSSTPDANGYLETDSTGAVVSQRQEQLEIEVSIYGPNCLDTYGLLRDGFEIPQNRFALDSAQMGFVEVTRGIRFPEKVNERFIDRVETSVIMNHQIKRVYPILTLVSASGTIYTATGDEIYLTTWKT